MLKWSQSTTEVYSMAVSWNRQLCFEPLSSAFVGLSLPTQQNEWGFWLVALVSNAHQSAAAWMLCAVSVKPRDRPCIDAAFSGETNLNLGGRSSRIPNWFPKRRRAQGCQPKRKTPASKSKVLLLGDHTPQGPLMIPRGYKIPSLVKLEHVQICFGNEMWSCCSENQTLSPAPGKTSNCSSRTA